jgi:uncharacterized protein YceK
MKIQSSAIAIAAALLFSGCATIVSGTTQQIQISTNPTGANVYTASRVIDNKGAASIKNKVLAGVAPLAVTVSRKDGTIIVEKDGYLPVEVAMKSGMNPWVWGDIAMTSLLSTSIDTSTGAANEFDPGSYVVDLVPATK